MSKPTINLNDKVNKEDIHGTLIVVLLKARNLNDKHSFRKQDVYAKATLNGVEKRSQVDIKGGQHPEWDCEVRFTIMKDSAAEHRNLEVACYAPEPRSEDLLGKAIVDIAETLKSGEFDDWVSLDIDGVARGELYLEMTYYANAPPASPPGQATNKFLTVVQSPVTLTRRPSKLSPTERLSRMKPSHSQTLSSAQAYTEPHPLSSVKNPGSTHVANPPPVPPALMPNNGSAAPGRSEILFGSSSSRPTPQVLRPSQPPHPSASLPPLLRPGPSSVSPSTNFGRPISPNPYLTNPYLIGNSPTPNPGLNSDHIAFDNQSIPTFLPPSSNTRYVQEFQRPTASSWDERVADADPYLQTRYQTPLPLPPGISSAVKFPSSFNPARLPTPPRNDTLHPNGARFEALKKAESEAAQRKAQEQKDLELAMQLDRELNLEEERGRTDEASARMPGGFSSSEW